MSPELSLHLLRLDPAVREALARSREKYAVTEAIVEELAWAAFHRNWDGPMVEAWAAAKSANHERLKIPTGPVRKGPPIDPLSPWAFPELGLRSGVLPGSGVLDDEGWGEIGGRRVTLGTYARAARKLLRDRAAANPNSTLASELHALEADRRRARLVMALSLSPVAHRPVRRTTGQEHRVRRSRRARRARACGRTRARRGADPPDPPSSGAQHQFRSVRLREAGEADSEPLTRRPRGGAS
jgi:hypothetical protein